MKKIHGILGAILILVVVADILLFLFKDNSFREEPSRIFTDLVESVGGE